MTKDGLLALTLFNLGREKSSCPACHVDVSENAFTKHAKSCEPLRLDMQKCSQ